MSILGMLSGTRKARKIANLGAHLWQETVNFMVIKGVELEWADSTHLLCRAYSLAVFRYRCKNVNASQDKMGAVIVVTAQFLGDILKNIWARQLPPQQISQLVNDIVEALPQEYHEWHHRVNQACQDAGLFPPPSMDLVFEKAVSLYLDDLESWYHQATNDNLNTSDKFELHRMVSRHLSSI